MRDVFPTVGSLLEPVTVRLRCAPCEVAWSGPADSSCWVCGEGGTPLNTALVVRDRTVVPFDFELFV